MSQSQLDDSQRCHQGPVGPIHSYAMPGAGAGSLPSTLKPHSFQIPVTVHKLHSSASMLDWTELELLSHYLTHTSRIIPFDTDDLYALRVGIPNLAFCSKPLMSSIIALAAVCKSHDLVKRPHQNRAKILDLLILAERHHRASLLRVQLDIAKASEYDYVLANATLMVLYASASHCVRIRLAETQLKDELLPTEFMPAQSQWISLIRAAHLAFAGLLNDHSETSDTGLGNTETFPTITLSPCNSNRAYINDEIIYPQNGPTEKTKDLLFPILAASSGPALKILRAKARATWKAEEHTVRQLGKSTVDDVSLQACFESLEILGGIMTEVFSLKDASPPITSCSKQSHSGLSFPPVGRLSTVSGWLRDYVARVTSSTTTPRPLRRVIMAFLNRVPAEYLGFVQTTLDSMSMQTGNDQQESWRSSNFELLNSNAVHKLALDIFAHWVVLVMLLDGVWWIGGIGAWELGRIVSFTRAQGWLDLPYKGEKWWPESMHIVGRELRNLADTK